jgi:hypothetical protein
LPASNADPVPAAAVPTTATPATAVHPAAAARAHHRPSLLRGNLHRCIAICVVAWLSPSSRVVAWLSSLSCSCLHHHTSLHGCLRPRAAVFVAMQLSVFVAVASRLSSSPQPSSSRRGGGGGVCRGDQAGAGVGLARLGTTGTVGCVRRVDAVAWWLRCCEWCGDWRAGVTCIRARGGNAARCSQRLEIKRKKTYIF